MNMSDEYDFIIYQIEEHHHYTGDITPETCKNLLDSRYIISELESGGYSVYNLFEKAFSKTRLGESIIKFYLDRGFILTQTPKFLMSGCGYPSDSYDICTCFECENAVLKKVGYTLELIPIKI